MSLPIAITDLLHGHAVESERLELKRSWNAVDVLHTLCAFANDVHNLGGGYVVIGVAEENGRPVLPPIGLTPQEVDRIQKQLLNLGNAAIRPPYHPLAAPYVVDGKLILVLWAPGGRTRPYRARTSLATTRADDFAWFIRKGSNTVKARGADEAELMGLAATVPLDDRENIFGKVDDLSRDLIVEYLLEVKSDLAKEASSLPLEELGRRMGIVGGTREAPYPINVGLLFFHPEPWRFFPATQIDVVWFPDGRGGDRFTEKEFRGPLHKMLRDALSYIEATFLATTVVKHAGRAEADRVANYPLAAIEEALVNAVYHRGYDVREPVEVSITRDQLTVVSYPGPDRSVRREELAAGRALSRRYRNRRIGEFLKELDLTEGRGTGIPKILRAMHENGSPPPIFDFDEDHSFFATVLPVHPAAPGAGSRAPTARDVSDRDHVGTKSGPSRDQARVLAAAVEPRSMPELMRVLGRTNRTKFRGHVIAPLLEADLLEMTIPGKPRSSKQQYRTTAAGLALLHQEP